MSLPYHETLPCGGILTINNNDWYIKYNLPALNPRSSFVSIFIKSSEIDNHITALKANLEIFKDYSKHTSSCIYGIPGAMNMTINLHGHSKGVCLNEYYRPVTDDYTFEIVKNSFNYAKTKASEILNCKSTN